MKKLVVLFLLIPLLSFNVVPNPDIVGKWTGKDDKNKIGSMIFDSEGYATLEVDGQTLGGKEFELDGKKGSMTYVLNLDADPVHLDLVITDIESNQQMKMLFIAEFIDDDSMKLGSNFNSERPSEFTSDNSITLHRE